LRTGEQSKSSLLKLRQFSPNHVIAYFRPQKNEKVQHKKFERLNILSLIYH